MSELFQNLAHTLRGAAFIFFTMLSISIYPDRKKNNMKRILFWSMVFLAFLELKDMVFLDSKLWENQYVSNIVMLIDMIYVPMMALFFFETVSPGWIRKWRVIGFFAPLTAMTVLYICCPDPVILKITMSYVMVFGCVVAIVILMAVSDRDNKLKNYFSDTVDISVLWVRNAICALFVCLVFWNLLLWDQSWLGDSAFYAISIVVWAYIYSLAIKHKVIDFPEIIHNETDMPDNGEDAIEDIDSLQTRLNKCMTEQELFLNPKLTLQDLASEVGTNRTYLSDYLNNTMNMTFYEYINKLRANKSAELIKGDNKLTLAEIAEKSGFNSISTFNRAFTKYFGCTPGRFARKH